MFKIIKKSFKYFIIIIGIIILIPTIMYLVLQISEVQTLLVRRITSHFSSQIKSTISVSKIELKFFNKLSINDILIKDKNNDTLIYAQKATFGLRKLDFKNKTFRIGRVILIKPVVAFITDSSGLMNLNWYLDLIKNPSDTSQKAKNIISIEQVDISNARFSLINRSGKKGTTMMDFNNLNFSHVNGIIENLNIKNDTTSFYLYNLGFKESSGFLVKKMSSSVVLAKQNIFLKSAFINSESSIINIPVFGMTADSTASFKRFTEKVKLDILLEKSLINTSDLQYFIPLARGLNESVWLSGRIMGTVSELRGRNIDLSYRDNTYLNCDFDFSGLPEIENAYIYIGVNSLRTNAKDIEKINIAGKGNIIVPDVLYKLGNISFDGSFTGFTTDFVTYGEIRTSMGNMRTDISLRPEESKKYLINGLLTGNDINLGELTGETKLLGKLSIQANVNGYAFSFSKFAANLTGKIDSIEINSYNYRNVTFNGFFTEKTWDGSINIVDKNIKLDLLGMFNFKEKLPEFDFTLNLADANLYKLNIDRFDTTSSLSILLTSNFKGNNIDNLDGEIKLLNSNLKKYNNNLELYDFSIRTFKDKNGPVLSLRSDFVDADIRGYYNFASLGNLFKSTISTLMPSKFHQPLKRREQKKNNFTFEVNLKNTDKINTFFKTGLLIADNSYIKGAIFTDSLISITGYSKLLSIKNNILNDFSFNANVKGSELSLGINSPSLFLQGQSELKGFAVKLNTEPDNFIFTVDWDNKDKNYNRGNFLAQGNIEKNTTGNGKVILKINVDSTDIYTGNNRWKFSKSAILVDSNSVKINKLYVSNADNFYLVDGTVSEDPADTLHLEFRGIDITPLNYLIRKNDSNDPNFVPLDIKGHLNGKVLLTNVYRNILLEGNLTINNFSILGSEYGNIFITSTLDAARKVVNINASNNLGGKKMFDIKGDYDPRLKETNLTINAVKLPVGALNPLLKVFASDISGLASGKLQLTAKPDNIVLKGSVMAENASLKIDYLQTRYKMNDTIRFDKNVIKFNNIRLADEKGNIAVLNGSVYHNIFKEFSADLTINMNNAYQVLNTKPKDNELFYGTAYASGVASIKSGQNSLSFDISAKTGKNTKFIIPLNRGLSVSDYSFISFVDSNTVKREEAGIEGINSVISPPKKTGIDLNFDLEVTPDAEVQLIFDSKIGDIMKGHGSGNLNITMNTKGDFKMIGDYIIEKGDYLFTLRNIMNKSFTMENGGKITFNGDLDNAEIDAKAIYRLKASLKDILHDDRFSDRIPVECQLLLTGKLFNPFVGFNIYLPDADEETRTYLKNNISTDEELSRQFLYLLVMNSFYADPTFASVSGTSTGTSAMAVTTTEMLSNQLSNWLSQISNDFDIGFVYRPGSGSKDINPQEVEVALSTQLLNNKVVINGNFDVRGSATSTTTPTNNNQITGDFDAEYKITERIRFKVFNRYNDPYTGKSVGVPYTQGIGIFFKQDFDKFPDLFKKKVKSDMKKEDETRVKEK